MKRITMSICLFGLVLVVATSSHAAVISLALTSADFNDLGTLNSIPGWGAMTTLMEKDHLKGEVTSQPFQDSDTGDYYYLYQVDNIGSDSSWHMIEVLSLTPFTDADGSTTVGYLTGNEPAAFDASGTETPAGCSVNTDSGPTISFVFPGYVNPIVPGEVSKVLYVKSDLPPQEITGNIIDGSIADGQVIGPVPEPATIGFLLMGGFALSFLRKKH